MDQHKGLIEKDFENPLLAASSGGCENVYTVAGAAMPSEVLWIFRFIYDCRSSFRFLLACFLALLLSVTFLAKADAHTSSLASQSSSAGQQSADTRPLEL